MKILVVGGKGFIGSEIVRQSGADSADRKDWDIRSTHADFSDYDLVIMEAAITAQAEFEKNPRNSYATNVDGLLNVLEGCRKVSRMAFASSSAVYGLTNKPSKETDSIYPHNDYAASKAMGELLFKRYRPDGVILRYFNTYGDGENPKGDYKSIISALIQDPDFPIYGDGEQRRDFIHVKDVARITLELGMNASGTFNVGTGVSTSFNEIARILQRKPRHITNPIKDYQNFTQADVSKLRSVGVGARITVDQGIKELLNVKYLKRES